MVDVRFAAMASRRTWLYATGTPSRRWRRGGSISIPPARRRGGGSIVGVSAFDVVPTRPEKVEARGRPARPRSGAGTLSDARAARALLLGHGFGRVSRVYPSVLGRAQSMPARRAQIFTGVLRSQRQNSYHKACVAFGGANRAYSERQNVAAEAAFGQGPRTTPDGRSPNAGLGAHLGRLCWPHESGQAKMAPLA